MLATGSGLPDGNAPQCGMTAATVSARQRQHVIFERAHRYVLAALATLLVLAVVFVALLAYHLPPLKEHELMILQTFPPRTLSDLASQRDVLKRYAAAQPAVVLAGYCGAYILMQTFAIPGTIFLSLLAGGLYGAWRGGSLVAVVSTLGSCSCYCMSWALGQPLARALWPEQLAKYAGEVAARQHQLFNYILFLRVTPLLPNTFINVASPIVGVPLLPFALGTLVGCLPNNIVAVNAGSHLSDFSSLSDLYSGRLLTLGMCVGLIALAPTLIQQHHARQAAAATVGAAKLGKLA